jgi:putative membrane protein
LRDRDALRDPAFCDLLPRRILQSFEATPLSARTLEKNGTSSEERFEKVINDNTPTEAPLSAPATKLGGPKNMPLFILRQIQSILNDFHATAAPTMGAPGADTPMLDAPTWGNCIAICKEMTDQLSQAERIRDTPIPMALGIHVSVGRARPLRPLALQLTLPLEYSKCSCSTA